jgi:hypothetical protein
MSHKKLHFQITRTVRTRIDFVNNRAVISCKTKDGKTLDLETDLQTLDKINAEVRSHLERY